MATFQPSVEHFAELLHPLDDDAAATAAALATLDDEWTVYTRPRIGQEVPDFVALHPHFGVVTVQVAGWTPGEASINDGLVTAARRNRVMLYEQFFAFPGDERDPSDAVRSVIVAPRCTQAEAATIVGGADGAYAGPVVIWGRDDLDERLADMIVAGYVTPPRDSVERLRRELVPGGIAHHVRPPVQLSAGASLVAANPTGARVRGVTGPAGSGKSFALAARAARLAAEGKDVLVLCFNLTLADRLRMLAAARCAEYGADPTRVTCTSFHTFCARVVDDAISAGFVAAEPGRGTWPAKILAKTNDVFEQGFERRYDAVLVDEGQDFTLAWWDLLRRHVVRRDGEMLLVSDPTVDLGGKDTWRDSVTTRGAGFDEPWITMADTYRMGGDLLGPINDFARTHLDGVDVLPGVPADQQAVVGPIARGERTWCNVDRVADLGEEIGRQVVDLLREHPTLAPRDVVYLCEYHHDGLAAAAVIEDAGYATHHVYSRDPDARHLRKGRFWPGADAVKGCTVHSFKGWDSPAVVLGIGVEERFRRLAYASMTRVSSNHGGRASFLVVVNADPRLAHFRSQFELGVPPPPVGAPAHVPVGSLPGLPSP